MPIAHYHYFHGAALSLIAARGEFTGLTRLPGSGAYAINHDTSIYIKHSSAEGSPWHFTFTPDHQHSIRRLFRQNGDKTFVVLVCGSAGICLLSYGEYAATVDENFAEQENLTVERKGRGGFRIHGAQGSLSRVIPLNRFPRGIFEG